MSQRGPPFFPHWCWFVLRAFPTLSFLEHIQLVIFMALVPRDPGLPQWRHAPGLLWPRGPAMQGLELGVEGTV